MARYEISDSGGGLLIKIGELGGKQSEVAKALQECAEGRCACPTAQYEKLRSVRMTAGQDEIRVALVPKAGEVIDRQAIGKCLDYTAGKAQEEK